ncbi:hypothetical protein [Pedobacter sp. L105]|uniref:DODA-type extradiol aromatic ring-opening family dioxygenase n=1 Tax=Pedobacter sp. L105 TaxID=1641871 RepID=UPI00352A5EFF
MHLFPDANIPVFQMSINYYASGDYHFQLGRQLRSLRDKGILIISSGALIHNQQLARPRDFSTEKNFASSGFNLLSLSYFSDHTI